MAERVVKQLGPGKEALPPAGDEQRDELLRRRDELAEEADRLEAQLDTGAIDPAKLDPSCVEREVRRAVNDAGEVFISNALPSHRYIWVFRDPLGKFGNRYVHAMQALGWERVAGDMPEAREHRSVDGGRWVADCLLMRMRKDRWAHLQLEDRKKRLMAQEGITADLLDVADRRGVRVLDRNDDKLNRLIGAAGRAAPTRIPSSAERRRAFARSVAQEILSETQPDNRTPAGLYVPANRR